MASGRTRDGDAALVGKQLDWCWAAALALAARIGEAAACENTCDWPRRAAASTVWSAVGIRAGDRNTVDSFRTFSAADSGAT